MKQFGVEPKDTIGLVKAIVSFLPLRWQQAMLAIGIIAGVAGWLAAAPLVMVTGAFVALSSFASRPAMRLGLRLLQRWLAPIIAQRYAADRLLFSQLYFNERDQCSLFLIEQDTIGESLHRAKFRIRLIRLGRLAIEIPLKEGPEGLAFGDEHQGSMWNPPSLQASLNELYVHQKKGFWNKVARVYGLPTQEIVGVGIPGGGTGVHGVFISLLDVKTGLAYNGRVSIWHDLGAPSATLHVAPFNRVAAAVACRIALRFGVQSANSKLRREGSRWRAKHGRAPTSGADKLRWFALRGLLGTQIPTGVKLGQFDLLALFKGPVLLVRGDSAAIVYVPTSPYDFGKVQVDNDGRVIMKFQKGGAIEFRLDGEVFSFEILAEKNEADKGEASTSPENRGAN